MMSIDRRVALSSMDVPHSGESLVHACEDCACPTSGVRARQEPSELDDAPLVLAHGVVDLPVDDEHSVLFNPHGNGCVVVLSEIGRAVAARFTTPARVSDIVAAGVDPEYAAAFPGGS